MFTSTMRHRARQRKPRAIPRVLPGEGVIDLPGFLRGLRAAGYQGYIAAEVLAPQDLAPTPDEAAARVRTALQTVGL
ncbi:MAG: sugar phosphate isomerase/epimerase [Cytophagales bacterium]|nr:sugar phosphate isomerase/epimerase [Armatimonadota bacterium]